VVPVGTQTFVRLQAPAGGTYKVSAAAGPPITDFAVAHGLPNPKVTGDVTGHGRRQVEVTKGHRVVIHGVPGIDSGKIEVAGLREDIVAGKPVKAKLKAKPKHRRGPHRPHPNH